MPRLWPDSTIVCIGTGPSLTREDVDYCQGRARVIAIKHAIEWAPWADVLYAAGGDRSQWWPRSEAALKTFQGMRYTLDPASAQWAQVLRNTGFVGLEESPDGLRTGKNSGYQGIGIAAHLGAARIVLLGYDMAPDAKGRDHYFGPHWHGHRPPFASFLPLFDTLVEPLAARGIVIVNASRQTALTCFPRLSLAEALADQRVCA